MGSELVIHHSNSGETERYSTTSTELYESTRAISTIESSHEKHLKSIFNGYVEDNGGHGHFAH